MMTAKKVTLKGCKLSIIVVGLLLTWGLGITFAQQKTTLHVISNRFPLLEFYVQEMTKAIEGVKLEARMQPYSQTMELIRISLGGGQVSPYAIIYADDAHLYEFAARGWLEPLDKYIEKYRTKYKFGDIPKNLWDAASYGGHIYGIPMNPNGIFFFYRKDLFEKYKLKPPKTYDQYLEAAEIIQKNESMYGTTLSLAPGGIMNTFHGFLYGYGGRWFDENNNPVFNGPAGVKALTMIKKLMKYAPPGVLSYENDQAMVALQQEMVAMGEQFFTRADAMDNAQVSKVVGKMEFAVPPSVREGEPPHTKLVNSTYSIAKNLPPEIDKDLVFRVMAEALDEESMTKAAQYGLVPRESVYKKAGVQKSRWVPAALETMKTAVTFPKLPQWAVILDKVGHTLGRALAGEIDLQEALDKAAAEAKEILEKK